MTEWLNDDETKRERKWKQEMQKKEITVFRSMKFQKEILHAIIHHLGLVISHRPDSHKSNTQELVRH